MNDINYALERHLYIPWYVKIALFFIPAYASMDLDSQYVLFFKKFRGVIYFIKEIK